jgi:hypothetical protein
MKLMQWAKDGGPDSPVTGLFLVEIKSLFSVVVLHFGGTREAYHSHAFNALTLWVKGAVEERVKEGSCEEAHLWYAGDLKYTPRGLMHKVVPIRDAWAISFRGPWADTWKEFINNKFITLTHGRKVVAEKD